MSASLAARCSPTAYVRHRPRCPLRPSAPGSRNVPVDIPHSRRQDKAQPRISMPNEPLPLEDAHCRMGEVLRTETTGVLPRVEKHGAAVLSNFLSPFLLRCFPGNELPSTMAQVVGKHRRRELHSEHTMHAFVRVRATVAERWLESHFPNTALNPLR